MSTRIDISVAGDLLRRQNRAQQEANRQGLLERQRRERLAQRGIEEIRREREAEKRRRNGEPIYGQRLGQRRIEEPAALLPTTDSQLLPGGGQFFAIYDFGALNSDTETVKVSSGDGTQWVTAQLSLPGKAQFYAASTIGPPRPPATEIGIEDKLYLDEYISDPTGTIIREYSSNTLDPSFLRTVALPCGGSSAVVLVIRRVAGSSHRTGFKCTSAVSRFVSVRWQPTAIEIVEQERTVAATGIAAFLVTPTTVRALSVPQVLKDQILTMLPDPIWSGSWLYGIKNPQVPGTSYGPIYLYRPAAAAIGAFMPEFTYAETFYNPFTQANETVQMTEAFYKLGWALTPEAPTVGYGALYHRMTVDGYSGAFGLASTPAVLHLLNTPGAFLDIPFVDGGDTAALELATLQALNGVAAFPPLFYVSPDIREGTSLRAALYAYSNAESLYEDSLGLISQWEYAFIREQVPLSEGAAPQSMEHTELWRRAFTVPFTAPRPDAGSLYGSSSTDIEHYWYTDWAQPARCRQLVRALGFTDEDLTP